MSCELPLAPWCTTLHFWKISIYYSPWAGLGWILAVACATTQKHCPVSMFARKTLTKLQKVTFVENKDAVRKRLRTCLSLHGWQTAMSPHVGTLNLARSVQWFHQVLSFENSHWAGLGRILGCCLRIHRQTLMSSVYLFLFPWEGFPWQTC